MDVCFQLSYTAVLSIVIFMQPAYTWFYIKNKTLDFIWKMNAVTIAAQILTLPISIYHFHQSPNYFLFTNFIAVPLSRLIVLGEILRCAICFISPLAVLVGKVLYGMVWLMNTWVERIKVMPFSLWDGLQINISQMILLTKAICFLRYWLLEKNKTSFLAGMFGLLAFITVRSISLIQAQNQQRVIVYNVPQRGAIDNIDGRNYQFIGDSILEKDDFARNFHLKPSRILNRVYNNRESPNNEYKDTYFIQAGRHILKIDKRIDFNSFLNKPVIDLLILSKNPQIYISTLADNFSIRQVVFDCPVPAWKKNTVIH